MKDDKRLVRILSHHDIVSLLELINESCVCKDERDFRKLMACLKELVPFEFAICGMIQTAKDRSVKSYEVINVSYPTEWLSVYMARRYQEVDPVMRENLANFDLQYWHDTYKEYETPREFIFSACDFGLSKGYTHGVRNPTGNTGSIFSFAGDFMEREDRTEAILRHAIPHLHNALGRVVNVFSPVKKVTVTHREREVLNWLKSGKTNAEISEIMRISENTVKYHVKTIMNKFGSATRAQCVAIAVEQGLIDIG